MLVEHPTPSTDIDISTCMRLNGIIKRIKATILAMALTAVGPNLSWAQSACEDAFNPNAKPTVSMQTHRFDRLHPEAKAFWRTIADQYRDYHVKDFKNPLNKYLIANETKYNHGFFKFLETLGVKISQDQPIEFPDFIVLFERLMDQVEAFNKANPNLKINLKFKMHLKVDVMGSDVDATEILTPFAAGGLKRKPLVLDLDSLDSNVDYFYNMSKGEFIIGSVGTVGNVRKKYPYGHAITTDFLHDLAHLHASMVNPQFLKTMQLAAEKTFARGASLPPSEREAFFKKFEYRDKKDLGMFYLSESSWLVSPRYSDLLSQLPLISKLIRREISDFELDQSHAEQFRREIKILRKIWWDLFRPTGGLSADGLTFGEFWHHQRSQAPLNAVLAEMGEMHLGLLQNKNISEYVQDKRIKRLIGLLRHSPEMDATMWGELALADNVQNTKAIAIFKQMFPADTVYNSKWQQLNGFLYPSIYSKFKSLFPFK